MRWYEWDARKARSNEAKHGVVFEDAVKAFDDPFAISILDRIENGEQRWQTTGFVDVAVLMVVHTEEDEGDDEIVRIISARRATPRERLRYEEAHRSRFGR